MTAGRHPHRQRVASAHDQMLLLLLVVVQQVSDGRPTQVVISSTLYVCVYMCAAASCTHDCPGN